MMKRRRPVIWLGQSVDTSSLCSSYPELRSGSFLTSLGCAIRRPSLKVSHFGENLRERLGVTGPIMIDSGGFALMKNPTAKWTTSTVAEFISRIDADVFVSLDLPPSVGDSGPERLSKIHRSNQNFRILVELFPDKHIMPVVHGRTLKEVETSIDLFKRAVARPKWVGLGGIVPLLQNRYVSKEIGETGPEVFIARALKLVRSAFPLARIHAFGAGGTRTFPAVFALGADSGDSIAWRLAAGFGSIFLPFKSQRIIRWTGEKPPRKLLDDSDLQQISVCRCPICGQKSSLRQKVIALGKDFHNRSIHNAWTLSNQYAFWPSTREGMNLLVTKGILGKQWAKAANSS